MIDIDTETACTAAVYSQMLLHVAYSYCSKGSVLYRFKWEEWATYLSILSADILLVAAVVLVVGSSPPACLSLAWARSCSVRNMRAVPHCIMSRLIVLIGLPSTCRLIKCARDASVTGSTVIELLVTSRRLRLRSRQISSGNSVILLSRKSNIFKCGKLLHSSLGIRCGKSRSLYI